VSAYAAHFQFDQTYKLQEIVEIMSVNTVCSGVGGVAAAGLQEVLGVTTASRCEKTKFAKALLRLLEATEQLAELEGNLQLAPGGLEGVNDEKNKVAVNTLHFAKESLIGQQLHAIELLQDLSARGGSLLQDPQQETCRLSTASHVRRFSAHAKVDVHELSTSCGETSSSDGEDWCKPEDSAKSLRPPPGLSAPPGLCAPPPGLSAPPGLEKPASCDVAKKTVPWRSSTVEKIRATKKLAPWRSTKNNQLDEAEPVDTIAVSAVNKRISAVLDHIELE
jgi:hypothetical protein